MAALTPPPVATYPDVDTAFTALQLHAKGHGYALVKVISRPSRVLYLCDRAGQYNPKGKELATDKTKQRIYTGSKKCSCLMKVDLRLDTLSNQWMVKVLEGVHNHPPSVSAVAHPVHRKDALTPEIYAQISTLAQASLTPGRILDILRVSDPKIPLISKDISNTIQQIRAKELGSQTPIQWLLQVSINPFNSNLPTNQYGGRSLNKPIVTLDIFLPLGLLNDLLLFTPHLSSFGRRTLMF
jgi:hypothetical protein